MAARVQAQHVELEEEQGRAAEVHVGEVTRVVDEADAAAVGGGVEEEPELGQGEGHLEGEAELVGEGEGAEEGVDGADAVDEELEVAQGGDEARREGVERVIGDGLVGGGEELRACRVPQAERRVAGVGEESEELGVVGWAGEGGCGGGARGVGFGIGWFGRRRRRRRRRRGSCGIWWGGRKVATHV